MGPFKRFLIPVSLHRKGAPQQVQHDLYKGIAEEENVGKGEWGAREKKNHRL